MAQQFTLSLINPAITSSASKNEIYYEQTGGNALELKLTNKSGFDTAFVSGGTSGDLLIKIPKAIIDATATKAITVAGPWVTDGIYTPDTDPDTSDNKTYFVLKLTPPASPGVAFKDGATVTIKLANIAPTAKGNATVIVSYQFVDPGLPMNASDQLAVLGANKPGDKPLIGDTNALRYTTKVNDGPATNPIVVTASPVTAANAAENRLHLNFTFQGQNMPTSGTSSENFGELVPAWDPTNPPTFRVQFPYFSALSTYPAPLDLTDDLRQEDTGYNSYTSARNIELSLSQSDPKIKQNNWWTIALDPHSNTPSWLITPRSQNKHLFTGAVTGPNGSGPFLDLFFSHIYSALPIDPTRPQTLLYLETYNIPGFDDRLIQQPLSKINSVEIKEFYGSITMAGGVTTLGLNWQTSGAAYCIVSGDSNQQGTSSHGDYKHPINLTDKLASKYTLTAFGKDGTSTISKDIYVQWTQGTQSSTTKFTNPTGIDVSPDGKTLYVAGNNALYALNSDTMVDIGDPLIPPDKAQVRNVIATPDGSRVFVALSPFTGGGLLQGYTSTLKPLDISAANPGLNSSPNLFPMAVSADGSQLAISAPYPQGQDAQFIAGYSTSDMTLQPVGGSPAKIPTLRQMGLAICGDNLYYPDSGGLGVLNRTTFKPLVGSPISLKSTDDVSYTPGPIAVSPDGKTVATLAMGRLNQERAFILCLVDVVSMKLITRVQVHNGYANAPPVTTTGMAYALDGTYLFVFGTDYSKSPADINKTLMSVYDPVTLQPLPWSPIPVTKFYGDFVMAPDGSRIYISALDSGTAEAGNVIELVPVFAQD